MSTTMNSSNFLDAPVRRYEELLVSNNNNNNNNNNTNNTNNTNGKTLPKDMSDSPRKASLKKKLLRLGGLSSSKKPPYSGGGGGAISDSSSITTSSTMDDSTYNTTTTNNNSTTLASNNINSGYYYYPESASVADPNTDGSIFVQQHQHQLFMEDRQPLLPPSQSPLLEKQLVSVLRQEEQHNSLEMPQREQNEQQDSVAVPGSLPDRKSPVDDTDRFLGPIDLDSLCDIEDDNNHNNNNNSSKHIELATTTTTTTPTIVLNEVVSQNASAFSNVVTTLTPLVSTTASPATTVEKEDPVVLGAAALAELDHFLWLIQEDRSKSSSAPTGLVDNDNALLLWLSSRSGGSDVPTDVDDFLRMEDDRPQEGSVEFFVDEIQLCRELCGYQEGCEPELITDCSLLTWDEAEEDDEDDDVRPHPSKHQHVIVRPPPRDGSLLNQRTVPIGHRPIPNSSTLHYGSASHGRSHQRQQHHQPLQRVNHHHGSVGHRPPQNPSSNRLMPHSFHNRPAPVSYSRSAGDRLPSQSLHNSSSTGFRAPHAMKQPSGSVDQKPTLSRLPPTSQTSTNQRVSKNSSQSVTQQPSKNMFRVALLPPSAAEV